MEQLKIALMRPHVSESAIEAVTATLRSGWIGQGPKVQQFEEQFQQQLHVSNAVAVNSAAAGLRLALAVAGVGPGDEVITTPLTWQATNHPILEQGAIPVFADIQLHTGNLDPADVARRITSKTKAILVFHWAGYPADLAELNQLADKHGIFVIEEASEALGGQYHGQWLGTISRFTVFSFYATQLITTAEGGMVVAKQPDEAIVAKRRRWFGIDREQRKARLDGYYDYDTWEVGYSYPMMDVNAAMGLAHLADWRERWQRRADIAKQYREVLATMPGVTLFNQADDRVSGHQLCTIHVERRDDFCQAMRDRGVQVGVVHVRNDQYTIFGGQRTDLPQLDQFSQSYINIPLHEGLTPAEVDRVINSLKTGW